MEEAEKLGELIIHSKTGACVDFWPIKSAYNWHGSYQCISQAMLLVTTFEAKLDPVTQLINDNHTYSVPLIAGVDTRRMNHSYKEWMMKEIQ